MKGILIDPVTKIAKEIDFDEANINDLKELLDCTGLDSRRIRQNESLIYGIDVKPDAADGFVMPLERGNVRVMGPALVIGVVGGRNVDTAMTPAHVVRGLFWVGIEHVVS